MGSLSVRRTSSLLYLYYHWFIFPIQKTKVQNPQILCLDLTRLTIALSTIIILYLLHPKVHPPATTSHRDLLHHLPRITANIPSVTACWIAPSTYRLSLPRHIDAFNATFLFFIDCKLQWAIPMASPSYSPTKVSPLLCYLCKLAMLLIGFKHTVFMWSKHTRQIGGSCESMADAHIVCSQSQSLPTLTSGGQGCFWQSSHRRKEGYWLDLCLEIHTQR